MLRATGALDGEVALFGRGSAHPSQEMMAPIPTPHTHTHGLRVYSLKSPTAEIAPCWQVFVTFSSAPVCPMSEAPAASYLDSVLDFVAVELLGCALPRQKPPPSVIKQPPLQRDPATTWSNDYKYEPGQHIVPQLEKDQGLRTSSDYW